jgi:hypothetical protein
MIGALGYPEASIKTLTLITSPEARSRGRLPDIYGALETAETIDLFYMFRR